MVDFKVSANEYNKELIPFWGNHFLNGNGYFGIRGTLEEYTKENMPCINMAGIYDRVENKNRESVNAPNPVYTYIVVNGTKYILPDVECFSNKQELDFYNGIHKRETVWETSQGKITVRSERFASMSNQHIIGLKYSIWSDYDADIEIFTGIDGDVWDINGPHFVKIENVENDGVISCIGTTVEKGHKICSQEYTKYNFESKNFILKEEMKILRRIKINAKKDKKYTFEKICIISSDVDESPCNLNIKELDYETEKANSIKVWKKIWDISAIEIIGDEKAELALNYSIYHLNCIAPRNSKNKSIAARGLSGQVYKGAIFWDTEMFMIDYYLHTEPEIAKTLINYRISTLKGAKEKAKKYGLEGAFYAWESQEGGYEGCAAFKAFDVFCPRPVRAYFCDKQYHVSSAVIYAFDKYINATSDYSILENGGLETIIECAKMFRSLLIKKVDGNRYEILDVVGPDEYHERVNNNAYTNRMAKLSFEKAFEFIDYVKKNMLPCYKKLSGKYDLEKLQVVFKDSAEKIFIKEPNENGVIEQFDGYFDLENVMVEDVRKRIINPKEYWGSANGIASHTQVLKQADVVAMLSIFKDEYSFDIMQKNWEYYEPRTEHGSSLSACMYSMLLCNIKNPDEAYPLFLKSAAVDMKPGGKEWLGPTYIGGTHPASEGGAWIVAVKGFAGFDIVDGKPVFKPNLPKHWKQMKFKILLNNKIYKVDISNEKISIN